MAEESLELSGGSLSSVPSRKTVVMAMHKQVVKACANHNRPCVCQRCGYSKQQSREITRIKSTRLGEGPRGLCGTQCSEPGVHRPGEEVCLDSNLPPTPTTTFSRPEDTETAFASSVQKCLGCSESGLPMIHIASPRPS